MDVLFDFVYFPDLPYVGRYVPLRFYLCNRLADWYAQSVGIDIVSTKYNV